MRKLDNDPLKLNGSGSSRRILKLESLLRAEVGAAIERELELPASTLLTITSATVLPDLSQVRLGVSILPTDKQDQVFKILIGAIPHLQQLVNRRLRVYRVPKLVFYLDNSLEQAGRISALLDNIRSE